VEALELKGTRAARRVVILLLEHLRLLIVTSGVIEAFSRTDRSVVGARPSLERCWPLDARYLNARRRTHEVDKANNECDHTDLTNERIPFILCLLI
jgi:hypothetical protein